ncbi:uncharacterized protein PV09_07922 [Verruconis gallopava]|uniref:Uncharacterized protein n=1 Tax=Verruconis gallopava TaxID=253628 RepID=A0A0D2A1K1_9PEZI|nr:uncharacterized protein PV09_07922 [Verruconis gallopava]KIW00568.1 hypothetical protein PV09_07922 [Verruconis gallopava]
MESGPQGSGKHITIAGQDLAIPLQARRRSRPWEERHHGQQPALAKRDPTPETTISVDVIQITLTRTYANTIAPTTLVTSSTKHQSLSSMTTTLTSGPAPVTLSLSTMPSSTTTFQSASTGGIMIAKPPPFPTALVASLCTLLPLSGLVILGFYLYYRKRQDSTSGSIMTSISKQDKYVWGPLGLVTRRERDRQNPVLTAQEAEARPDPVAEAIRKEERERLANMRPPGESKFYAPGVRHLVEYVGSRERMKVIIDWRDRVKMERLW